MSDILLEDDYGVKFTAPDIRLDFQDRRTNSTQFRRAIVHDTGDALTLNWGNDYPGGVNIAGNVNFAGDGHNTNIFWNGSLFYCQRPGNKNAKLVFGDWAGKTTFVTLVENFIIRNPNYNSPTPSTPLTTLSHDAGDNSLVVNKGNGYVGGVIVEGNLKVKSPGSAAPMDLVQEIQKLRKDVDALKQKVGI